MHVDNPHMESSTLRGNKNRVFNTYDNGKINVGAKAREFQAMSSIMENSEKYEFAKRFVLNIPHFFCVSSGRCQNP